MAADRIVLLLLAAILILSASTSAYAGILLLPFVAYIVKPQHKKLEHGFVLFSIGAMGLIIFAYFFSPTIANYVNIFIIDKPQSYSALYRLNSVINAWQYFLEYPILGLGWGTIPSDDLFIGLFAATGFLGFIAFSVFILHLLIHVFKALKKNGPEIVSEHMPVMCATSVSFILLLFLNTFSGFSFVFSHFWFILGMTMAVSSIVIGQKRARIEKTVGA